MQNRFFFMRTGILILFAVLSTLGVTAQTNSLFTPADYLKGGLRPERTSFNVHFYDLNVSVSPDSQSISGMNTVHFTVVNETERIQIDLFPELHITDLEASAEITGYDRSYGAIFINFSKPLKAGSTHTVSLAYNGKPIVAERAPWDGGFVWEKDQEGRPWIATAVQGEGASLWWPVKEHLSDEPDSMAISVTVPEGLTCISNGNLRSQRTQNSYTTFDWFVSYPINVYNVALNIGHYAHIEDELIMEGRAISADYYVLDYHEQKARRAFPSQVEEMFEHLTSILGPYPFPKDGYALVEVPYWGMEHQSAVAYGNEFEINEYGFDFIMIHETGHEYFGNSISVADPGELWIHEAFTTYLEVLFLEDRDGYEKSVEYLETKKPLIKNYRPVLGPKGVYFAEWTDADMYYKGAWMLHSIRHTINDDKKWLGLIKEFYQTFKGSTVDTETVISFFNERSETDLRPIFMHYLTELNPPLLSYKTEGGKLHYKWAGTDEAFNMPIEIKAGKKTYRLNPTKNWQTISIPKNTEPAFSTDKFYFDLVKEG